MTDAIVVAKSTGTELNKAGGYEPIIDMVLNTVSERSRRDYRRALTAFMEWHEGAGRPGLNRAAVNAHIAHLKAEGVTDSSINQRLAAIRKLASEAAANGLIDESAAHGVKDIQNIKRQGRKLGNWLTRDQAAAMINAPDMTKLKGLRDRAVLAVMIGCGLRREEVCTLSTEHLQQREGRWVLLDLAGKHNRTRTVPMAAWVKAIIDDWVDAAGINDGYLFPPMRRGDHIQPGHMSSQAIWLVVQQYAPIDNLAPHDLRRTFAKLAHKADAPLEQIQMSLGHASIETTERYIGVELDLAVAPSDLIQLDLDRSAHSD